MSRRPPTTDIERPYLVWEADHLVTELDVQLAQAAILREDPIPSDRTLRERTAQVDAWVDYCREILTVAFTNAAFASEFASSRGALDRAIYNFDDELEHFDAVLIGYTNKLRSIRDRVPFYKAPAGAGSGRKTDPNPLPKRDNNKVFVVHGHDEKERLAVCNFVARLGLEYIVLSEQAHRGATIIEKIEANADVGFAIVLMTKDDIGGSKGASTFLPRARQNVVLELGYFMGRLGRSKVCVLYEEGVELPSDWNGVGWHALDARQAWHLPMAKELKAAGLSVDLNNL